MRYYEYNKIEPHHIVLTILISLMLGVIIMLMNPDAQDKESIGNCVSFGGGHACYATVRNCEKNGGGKSCDGKINKVKKEKEKKINALAHKKAVGRCKKFGGGNSCKNYK